MSDTALPLAGRRVLLVEDEYIIAVEVKNWLRRAGADVVGPVPSVRQALELIADDDICAAVLDVNLGDGDTAYPVADKLRALGVPHLFATGDVQVSRDGDARTPRLAKPYAEAELVRAVAALLA